MFRRLSVLFVLLIVVLSLAACGGSASEPSSSSDGEAHLYDRAVVDHLKNGVGEDLDDQYAYIEASSSEVDIDTLADVYFNFFKGGDYNCLFIVYTDKSPYGVYMMGPLVEDNVQISTDANGQYQLSGEDECIIYVPQDDGTLAEFE